MPVISKTTAQAAAEQIRNETLPRANTCARVGGLFRDIVDSLFGSSPVPSVVASNASSLPFDLPISGDWGVPTDCSFELTVAAGDQLVFHFWGEVVNADGSNPHGVDTALQTYDPGEDLWTPFFTTTPIDLEANEVRQFSMLYSLIVAESGTFTYGAGLRANGAGPDLNFGAFTITHIPGVAGAS